MFVTRSGSEKEAEQLGSDPSWVGCRSNQHKVVPTSHHLKTWGDKNGRTISALAHKVTQDNMATWHTNRLRGQWWQHGVHLGPEVRPLQRLPRVESNLSCNLGSLLRVLIVHNDLTLKWSLTNVIC